MNLAVIGTGYVGLVSGTCFAEMGNNVVCVDNDPEKIKKLNNAELTIYEPGLDLYFYRNIAKKRLHFTGDLDKVVLENDIIFFCLPTPQGADGHADLKFVMGVSEQIAALYKEKNITQKKIIVNKSTVPVGTGARVEEIFRQQGLENIDVVSNPEFLREGFAVEDFMKPDRIVIGTDSEYAAGKMKALYEPFVRQGNPIIIMDRKSSEVTKYAANSYLATRITFMNEIANFCEKAGADVDMVRRGISTDTRIGKRFLFPGIGYGGSCFPKDVNALIKTGSELGYDFKILNSVHNVNEDQKEVLYYKVKEHFEGDLEGKKLAIWGLSFKPNTDDMREAPSIKLIRRFLADGVKIKAYDPAAMENTRFFFNDEIEYADSDYDALTGGEALLILTEWNEFRNPDFEEIRKRLKNPVIFDGRNIFNLDKMRNSGFDYYSIGREKVC